MVGCGGHAQCVCAPKWDDFTWGRHLRVLNSGAFRCSYYALVASSLRKGDGEIHGALLYASALARLDVRAAGSLCDVGVVKAVLSIDAMCCSRLQLQLRVVTRGMNPIVA